MTDPMAMPALGFEQQYGFGGGATDPYLMMLMRRRALAEALQKQGQPQQPMTHPLQVLGSIAQQGVGAWQQDKTEREYLTYAQRQQQAERALLQEALGGLDQQARPAPVPMAAPAPSASGAAGGGDYFSRLRGAESGGRVDAANPRSSARGPDQFIDGTWLDFAKANPQHFQGMSQDQILAARTDPTLGPKLSREATAWYANSVNGPALKAAGLPVNDFTIALGHRFGPGDAVKLLQADPNAPAASVLPPAVLAANPNLGPATVGGVLRPLESQFGTGQTFAAPGQDATAQAGPAPQQMDQRAMLLDRARRLMASGSPRGQQAAMQIIALAKALPEPPNWTTANVGGNVITYNQRDPNQIRPLGPSESHTPLPQSVEEQKRRLGAPYPEVARTPERQAQEAALRSPTTLSPGQVAIGPDGKPVASVPARPQLHNIPPGNIVIGEDGRPIANNPDRSQEFTRSNTLRDEFTKLTTDFRTLQDANRKIQSAAAANTGAGDMAMLYSFVKMLDPGSVVRESEFATAAASGSLGERIQGAALRIMSGERMAPQLRAEFLAEAKGIMNAQRRGYDQMQKVYKSIAERAGLNPEDIVIDQVVPETPTQAAPASSGSRIDPANPLNLRLPGAKQP